ncbi:MAG TPA: GerMN domain-containing protein [Spirochaetota bacterium]|nr:GerMN domain-containing protein [Spirochaetota bacterium]
MKILKNLTFYIYIIGITLTLLLTVYAVSAVCSNNKKFYFYYYNPLKNELDREIKTVSLPHAPDREKIIRKVLAAHLLGPVSHHLRNSTPEMTGITRIYLAPDKTLYLNLDRYYLFNVTPENEKKFIYSLYNTIFKNFRKIIEKIVITVDGRQFARVKGGYYYPPQGFSLKKR